VTIKKSLFGDNPYLTEIVCPTSEMTLTSLEFYPAPYRALPNSQELLFLFWDGYLTKFYLTHKSYFFTSEMAYLAKFYPTHRGYYFASEITYLRVLPNSQELLFLFWDGLSHKFYTTHKSNYSTSEMAYLTKFYPTHKSNYSTSEMAYLTKFYPTHK
jgi:hypothetical protein